MRWLKFDVRYAAQLNLRVLQAFFEPVPVQLHCWTGGLVWIVLLCLAVLDILHVNVEKHVR